MTDSEQGGWAEGLAPQHRYYLETRAVSAEVAVARGYRTANSKKTLEELGFGVAQRRIPALVVPVWAPWPSDDPAVYQARPDYPRHNAEGKALKFEYPSKATMHLDVHPQMRGLVGDHRVPLVITEGIVKADAGVSRLDVCVIGVAGVWCWRGTNDDGGKTVLADWEHVALNDREIIVVFDSDVMLKHSVHAALVRLGAFLERRGAPGLHYAYLPSGDRGKPVGLDDWLAMRADEPADRLIQELAALCTDRPLGENRQLNVPYEPPARRNLAEVEAVFMKWLAEPDLDAVRVTLAVMVANRASGDPVWLLIIAPPSSGKTEIIVALSDLPDVTVVGRFTEAGLLSGTPAKDRASDASGGLLRLVGDSGILICKDFGAILTMKHETRNLILQALRDVFDGRYDRDVGADGHRKLNWKGHCGFIGGTTEAIDSHHAVIAALGDRYISLRLQLPEDAETQADAAIKDSGVEEQMRLELGEAVAGFLGHLDSLLPTIDDHERSRITKLAALVVRCRSIVERDNYNREIVNVPRSEQPARIAKQLAKTYAGLLHIGRDPDAAWRLVVRVGIDSMPAGRRQVLDYLATQEHSQPTDIIGEAIRLPTTATRRHLEDLEAHGVVDRRIGLEKAHTWVLSDWCRQRWPTFPENSTPPDTNSHTHFSRENTDERTDSALMEFSGKLGDSEPWTEKVAVVKVLAAFPGSEAVHDREASS